jgi:TOTE conflict system, Archaeo-Eukaryotic Primase domain
MSFEPSATLTHQTQLTTVAAPSNRSDFGNLAVVSQTALKHPLTVEPVLPAKVVRRPPVTIDTLLTKAQFVSLVKHMMNGNPISHFLTVWRDEDGVARFAKAKPSRDAETHAGWTYDTITEKAKRKTSMGLYPKNKDNESTWAALDFDAHDHTQRDVAEGRAVRAFTLLLEYRDRYLILSASGRGYHVFILAHEPRPITEWARVLEDAADTVGAPIQDGVCELFPNERTAEQEVGRAIRVPGSLNPATGEVEKIMADTIQPLLERLARQETVQNNATRARHSLGPRELALVKEANSYFREQKPGVFFASSTQRLIAEVVSKHPITQKATRNGALAKLVGELFRKFGYALSEQIVSEHYRVYAANIRTPLDEHLREFRQAWKSFRKKETRRLNHSELELFDQLQTEPQREAFFLCRAFAKFQNEFPLSQASLADRLCVTRQGAGYVVARLIELGAIERTAGARPHSKSAYYRWRRFATFDTSARAHAREGSDADTSTLSEQQKQLQAATERSQAVPVLNVVYRPPRTRARERRGCARSVS